MSATTIWGLGIPYEYTDISHSYEPDFVVRLKNEVNLIVEIKGNETEQDRAKHEGAKRWVSAVNNWNELGKMGFPRLQRPATAGARVRLHRPIKALKPSFFFKTRFLPSTRRRK